MFDSFDCSSNLCFFSDFLVPGWSFLRWCWLGTRPRRVVLVEDLKSCAMLCHVGGESGGVFVPVNADFGSSGSEAAVAWSMMSRLMMRWCKLDQISSNVHTNTGRPHEEEKMKTIRCAWGFVFFTKDKLAAQIGPAKAWVDPDSPKGKGKGRKAVLSWNLTLKFTEFIGSAEMSGWTSIGDLLSKNFLGCVHFADCGPGFWKVEGWQKQQPRAWIADCSTLTVKYRRQRWQKNRKEMYIDMDRS